MFSTIGATVVDPDVRRRLAWGRDYPFARADGPVVVRGADVVPGAALDDATARFPLLAIGSNGSPWRLAGKFRGVLGDPVRMTPAVLHDHDVCALPYPVTYGAFPAGLVHRPGTRVDVVVLEVTEAQLEWLAVTEFGYHLGALAASVERAAGPTLGRAFVFLQRPGLFAVDGHPVALAAIPAEGRRLTAMTQAELGTEWVRRRFGPGVGLDDGLMRAVGDPERFVREYLPPSLADAVHPGVPGFTPHPAALPYVW